MDGLDWTSAGLNDLRQWRGGEAEAEAEKDTRRKGGLVSFYLHSDPGVIVYGVEEMNGS